MENTFKNFFKNSMRENIETMLLELGGHRNFEKHQNNFYLSYNGEIDEFEPILIDPEEFHFYRLIYFNSEHEALAAVREIGHDTMVKYYMGVDKYW